MSDVLSVPPSSFSKQSRYNIVSQCRCQVGRTWFPSSKFFFYDAETPMNLQTTPMLTSAGRLRTVYTRITSKQGQVLIVPGRSLDSADPSGGFTQKMITLRVGLDVTRTGSVSSALPEVTSSWPRFQTIIVHAEAPERGLNVE